MHNIADHDNHCGCIVAIMIHQYMKERKKSIKKCSLLKDEQYFLQDLCLRKLQLNQRVQLYSRSQAPSIHMASG